MRVVWGVLMLLLLGGCALESSRHSDSVEGHSACGDFLASASSASLRRMSNTPHSQSSHSPKNSSAILECQRKPLPKDSKKNSESTTSDSKSSGEARPLRDKNQIARSANLEASSGRGDCQGGRERLRNSSPSPLDEKNTKSSEVSKTLEVKAGDSEAIVLESKRGAESAMAGDSEKLDSESREIAESTNSNNQDSPPTNDINTPLANTTESDEEVQEDGQTYRAHISYKKGSRIKHGREILYYLNGTIAKQSFYLNGRLEGKVEIFSQKGVLIYEAHYRAGQLNGLCKIYDVASGRLKSEMNFKNGLQEGQMSVYDSSGKLWHRLEYKQGKRDGIAIEYDDSGKILRQTRYIDDKEVG